LTQLPADNANNYLYIVENYKTICYNVNEIKSKYHSIDDNIQIMAVTKTVSPQAVNIAISCGIKLLGENRVQEFLSKKDEYNKNSDVHFIGNLQSNKVKYIIDEVTMIQSVNSINLAQEIDKQSKRRDKIMDILVEINIGNEVSKTGIVQNELEDMLNKVSEMQNVRVKGLMAIPPINAKEETYANMQKLFVDIRAKKLDNINMSILSMGMSNDYELAIKYGANIVRIGTGLFGARKYIGGN